MKLMLDVEIKSPGKKINYADKIFLLGSCFTEHIGKRLEELKFPVLQNPNGILFDPVSVCKALNSYLEPTKYEQKDLFYLNELWQSWGHHSMFSGTDATTVLAGINQSQKVANEYLQTATWLIVTLGSSFSYRLADDDNFPVANCHRAPGQWFNKYMQTTAETADALASTIDRLKSFNPALQVVFTVSPVRHIRDGVVENNRSKARLLEAVHQMVEKYEHVSYFPAYELVIDVLRDYRFYDVDLVHPNYAATEFVFEKFQESYIDSSARPLMEEIKKISSGFKHKPFQPNTQSHQAFLRTTFEKVRHLQEQLPQLDFTKELMYFSRRNP